VAGRASTSEGEAEAPWVPGVLRRLGRVRVAGGGGFGPGRERGHFRAGRPASSGGGGRRLRTPARPGVGQKTPPRLWGPDWLRHGRAARALRGVHLRSRERRVVGLSRAERAPQQTGGAAALPGYNVTRRRWLLNWSSGVDAEGLLSIVFLVSPHR